MGYSTETLNDQKTHHWSVKLFDKPNGLNERNEHFDQHKLRLAEFKKAHPGSIEFGGPMLDTSTHQPIGSVFVFPRNELFSTQKQVEDWIKEDIYHQNKIWIKQDISLFLAATNPYVQQ